MRLGNDASFRLSIHNIRHASSKAKPPPKTSLRNLRPSVLPPATHHPELSRLPKSPTPLRSLRFQNVLPGGSETIVYPQKKWNPKRSLDPEHPATRQAPRDFPHFSSPLFRMRAYPFSVLKPFENTSYPFPEGAKPKHDENDTRHAGMGMVNIVGKKSVHPSAVVRTRIKQRTKEILRLVVTRGAHANENGQLEFNDSDVGEDRWLAKGWAYVFQPTLEILRHPLEGVVTTIRDALSHIKKESEKLETRWKNTSSSERSGSFVSTRSTNRERHNSFISPTRPPSRQSRQKAVNSYTSSRPR